ncbi:MAG: M16 family metallopeptidase [Halanaerobiaceae bacterium]
MRKKIVYILVFSLVFLFCMEAGAEVDFQSGRYRELSRNTNEKPEIEIPEYRQVDLENGISLYMLQDRELPYVELRGYIKGGSVQEPSEVAGITGFMVNMMNTGTRNYGELELNQYKEKYALDFNLGFDLHNLSFSGNALSTEKEELLSLAEEMLLQPKFDTSYRQRLLNERERMLEQARTEQESLAEMYFYRNIYSDHPYSYTSSVESLLQALERYSPDNLSDYYRRLFVPENTVIMVYGDFAYDDMKEKIRRKFGEWTGQEDEDLEAPPAVEKSEDNFGRVILVDKQDATQAKILMGHNLKIDDFRERINFSLANRVFGGGDFTCRLFENLRDEKGYVYDIGSSYTDRKLGGTYIINTSVKPGKTYETIELIKDEIKAITEGEDEIDNRELFNVKNQRNAFLPENYRYREDVFAEEVYNIEVEGRESGYLRRYIDAYNEAGVKEVNEAFRKHISLGELLTVIVGKKEDILPAFEEVGIEVEVVEVKSQ